MKALIGIQIGVMEAKKRIYDAFASDRGEGYVDTIVKMAIAVVIGSIILFALTAIIGGENDGLMGTIKEKIDQLFSKVQV